MKIAQYCLVLLCIVAVVGILISEFNIKATHAWYEDFNNGSDLGKLEEIAKFKLYRNISWFAALVSGVTAYIVKQKRN